MANYSYSFDDPTLTIRITGGTWGVYYRIFVRYADDPSSRVFQQDYYCPQNGRITATIDLGPNESYKFNAGEVSGSSTYWHWGSAPTVITGDGGGGGGGGGPTPPDPPTPIRPSNWNWWSSIYSGGFIQISASEWNAFCDKINEFRDYDGLSYYRFSYVRSGDDIAANVVNEAVDAIGSIRSAWGVPSRVYRGDVITADFFMRLQDALNSIR